MLSTREKREMREDAASKACRKHFRIGRRNRLRLDRGEEALSLDGYIQFLQDVQEIFGPFPISRHKTIIRKAVL